MAQARAGAYAEQVTSQVQTLTATLATVLQELCTLGDPDAAAIQIEAVTTEAEQRVATAMARAAHAEQERQTADHQRAEADAAAEDANARGEALTTQLATIHEEREKLLVQVNQDRETHTAETKRLTAQVTQAQSDIIELQARCDAEAADARTAHATLTAQLAAARQRFEDERAHAQTRLTDQRDAYEARLADLRRGERPLDGPSD